MQPQDAFETIYPVGRRSLKNPSSSWDTADADPRLASPQEREGKLGAYGLRTASVTQNNGGNGEHVGKEPVLAWLQDAVVPWDSCRTHGRRA